MMMITKLLFIDIDQGSCNWNLALCNEIINNLVQRTLLLYHQAVMQIGAYQTLMVSKLLIAVKLFIDICDLFLRNPDKVGENDFSDFQKYKMLKIQALK